MIQKRLKIPGNITDIIYVILGINLNQPKATTTGIIDTREIVKDKAVMFAMFEQFNTQNLK